MSKAPSSPKWIGPDAWSAYGRTGWLARWKREEAFGRMLPELVRQLEAAPPAGLLEYVPGFQTLLLLFKKAVPRQVPEAWWEGLKPKSAPPKGRLFTMPVRYSGPDLASLARARELSIEEVIRRHSAPVYTVRLLGFSPGFPYLSPLDPALHLARKATPRSRIEPGSVAIGGSHTGIYSVASPGGWHVIGKTDAILFNPQASTGMFLLAPGDRVRFVPEERA